MLSHFSVQCYTNRNTHSSFRRRRLYRLQALNPPLATRQADNEAAPTRRNAMWERKLQPVTQHERRPVGA